MNNKLSNYLKITGFINNLFRPEKTSKKTRIKLYSTLDRPARLYGSENWIIGARDATEVKCARKTTGYALQIIQQIQR
jgi:hypothetical protein